MRIKTYMYALLPEFKTFKLGKIYMRTREEQEKINLACKYHPKNNVELLALVNNEEISLVDIDTSAITDMNSLFLNSTRTDFSGIENWDTSRVTNMLSMFSGCKTFNEDISEWNVSNVVNMYAMFNRCEQFNQPIGKWDVSQVKFMRDMFCLCRSFNQDLSNWNVANVADMVTMFNGCKNYHHSLRTWKVNQDCLTGNIFFNSGLTYELVKNSFTKQQLLESGNTEIKNYLENNLKVKQIKYTEEFYDSKFNEAELEIIYQQTFDLFSDTEEINEAIEDFGTESLALIYSKLISEFKEEISVKDYARIVLWYMQYDDKDTAVGVCQQIAKKLGYDKQNQLKVGRCIFEYAYENRTQIYTQLMDMHYCN